MNRYDLHRLRLIADRVVGTSILDLGCAEAPNPYLVGERVVGLDTVRMEVAPPYTEHIVGDVTNLDKLVVGQTFDTICMGELIEHVERPYDLLRVVRGHIAEGGRLVMTTPNPLGLFAVVAEYLFLKRYYYTLDHTYYFTPRWVWRILERCGYEVLDTVGCGIWMMGLGWLPGPVSLSYQVVYVAVPTHAAKR